MASGVDTPLIWNHMPSDSDWRLSNSNIPPPIPVRTHAGNLSPLTVNANESDAYLSPVINSSHLEAVVLSVAHAVNLCPPLPPRQPLQRSLSLTHRPAPLPTIELEHLPDPRQQALAEMVATLQLSSSQRQAQLTTAASAPMLSQVVPITRWPVRESAQQLSPVHVIPLARWPLVDTATTRRLAMDGIVGHHGVAGNSNEYVEGPTSSQGNSSGHRRRARHKIVTTPHANHHTGTGTASAETTDAGSDRLTSLPTEINANRGRHNEDERRGFTKKIRGILLCGSMDSPGECSGDSSDYCRRTADGSLSGTVCRRCGQCRCSDCLRAEQSATLCRARSVVDTLTCMCCVRSVFYHCTKDDAGQDDDCSDAPCACCERPHCAMRWTVMALLLPCLPCLCLYPPLSCTVDALCRRHHSNKACRCARRSRSAGLKGLLESESSST